MGYNMNKHKMLAVVTLYNSVAEDVANNIMRYIDDVDYLIIWDNSPLKVGLHDRMYQLLQAEWQKIVWCGTGENKCIAPALNYSLKYAVENKFDLMLIMDQDSRWENFSAYRKEVETFIDNGMIAVFTPYVRGCDNFEINSNVQEKHFIINSGMLIPTSILLEMGGVDELAFPLDAIDHDIAFSVRKLGYKTYCLTHHDLMHKIGDVQMMGLFGILTPYYSPSRIYSIVRAHIIFYKKHRKYLTNRDYKYLYKDILVMTFLRIILAEPDKFKRIKAYTKGLYDGLIYKLNGKLQ